VNLKFKMVELKEVMRRWPSGVAILTSGTRVVRQGMTVSSFTSISVEPPLITVTMENERRTKHIVDERGYFAINLLPEDQQDLSDLFAGRLSETDDRFSGLEVVYGEYELPLLLEATAWLECRVVYQYQMPLSTLYVGEVLKAQKSEDRSALVYFNRDYHRIL
jgi:flavin reductase (DIM6/NTAB) family NADH-FMN oxidoreductase RutF